VSTLVVALVLCLAGGQLRGQSAASPLTLLSREGRRPMPAFAIDGQDFVALEDLATAFQLTVREESGAITVSSRGRTIVLTRDQPLASVAGRLISMPAPPARVGNRWFVPVDFIGRVLSTVYETRLELRRPSRLVIIGDLRVPRVTVRHEPLGTSARVTVDASPDTRSTIAQEAGRLTIRFEADALDVVMPQIQPIGFVQGIRVLDPTALAVDLGPRFGSYRAAQSTAGNTARLVLDLLPTPTETLTLTPTSPAATPPAATAGPPPLGDLPVFGRQPSPIRTITIDPGHGGDDTGVRGDVPEKDITLAVARRLKSTIEARLGLRVLLTRDDDRSVALDERTALANNNKANLFISLHANASPRPSASGASIYVAAFDADEQTRTDMPSQRLAVFGGGLRELELVPWDLAQTRHVAQSADLATMLEEQLRQRVRLDARPIERARHRVLESANMPAVLIEMGYLTNPEDQKALAGPNFQNEFVAAVFDAIVRFRDSLSPQGGER
jgi:N-acetylmuramoyl-L-alanine amidase